MPEVLISVDELRDSPWHFRIMYEKDFDSIIGSIRNHGIRSVANPLVAIIDKKYYVVDGHSRIKAAKKTDVKKIYCHVLENVINFKHLRIHSFQHNKEGFSNPLLLSDMFYEDFQLNNDVKKIAVDYNVSEEYVQSLLKIRVLHDDTKSIVNKIIENSKKKYQFILNLITPQHLANLASLDPEKQVKVADWIFRDILYGPADESLVSIPSIYEIIDEITKISYAKEGKTYKKRTDTAKKQKEFPLICRCGIKFDVNTKTNMIYEYVEKNDVIVKREFVSDYVTKTFSSRMYGKSELIDLVKKADGEVTVVLTPKNYDAIRE